MPRMDMSGVAEAARFELPGSIGHGGRNVTLHAYASSMQALGVGDAEMLDALMRANDGRCDPPLPDWEVRSIWRSVTTSYDKGTAGGRTGATGGGRGFAASEPPLVLGEGRPDLLPDLSGMSGAEQAQAWVRACFFEDDVVCLTRDFRDASRASETRRLAGQLLGEGGAAVLRRLLSDTPDGAWAVVNPLRRLDSPRRDSEVGRLEGRQVGEREVRVPEGALSALPAGTPVGTERLWEWAERPAYHHALVECDSLPPDEQLERICALFLHGTPERGSLPPIDAITWSGGKSWHVMVRCGGATRDQHDDRVRWLYEYCDKNRFPVDHHCGNPARLTRLPGAERGGEMQRLAWVRGR